MSPPGLAARMSGPSGWANVTGHDAGSPAVLVEGVILLGVRVSAYATINAAEHRRREAAGIGAVVNPGLLDRLLDLPAAGELHAVQDASLFAGFTRRWVAAVHRRIPQEALLEAKLCGVGLLDPQRRVTLLPADEPADLTADGWSWLLQEKTYRRWLIRRLQPLTEPGFQGQADSVFG